MNNKDIEIIEIYKGILSGTRKRFPRNFWVKDGKYKSIIIFKYLIEEVLKWDKDKIINEFGYEIISKYKLTAPYNDIYLKVKSNVIKEIYPELITNTRMQRKEITRKRISEAQKNLPKYKRDYITKGAREHRYCEEYAKKLSDTKLGEINPQHKLKSEQVIEIRRLWATGNYSCVVLGEKFGVKRQTITDIVYGRTWKHL